MRSPRTTRSERPSLGDPVRSRQIARAVVLDVLCVLVFVAVGRRSHGEGAVVTGVGGTAAPFLVGLFAGWLAVLVARDEPTSLRAGGVVVAATVVVGMLSRHTLGLGGTPPSFVAVATIFLTLFIVGWRLVARAVRRRS